LYFFLWKFSIQFMCPIHWVVDSLGVEFSELAVDSGY
jgi:hypothetical protein